MNEVKEIPTNAINNNPNLDNIPTTPLTEWSLIACLFGFLVRGIWAHFANQLQANQKIMEGLVTHIQETNDKLIEEAIED